MNIQFLSAPTNVWPAPEFYENVSDAVQLVLNEEPSGVLEEIRVLILREWLAYAWPAGRA